MKSFIHLINFLICLTVSSYSYASLLITPTRIHFEPRERTKEIIIVNTSDEIRSYALSWQERRQNEHGGYEQLTEEELATWNKASDIVRFSPRRITLGPGQNQKIKLMARRTSALPPEEFQSRLKFTLIPGTVASPPSESAEGGPRIQMNFFLNYTIPVTVKNHNRIAELNITSASFDSKRVGEDFGRVNIIGDNVGKTAIHGDFTVLFRAAGETEFKPIGFDNAVNVFDNVDTFRRSIPLVYDRTAPVGEFIVRFEGREEFSGKAVSEYRFSI